MAPSVGQQPKDAYATRDSVVNNREDVVSEVLSHLSPGDLATCMRVCRLWYDEASRFLYRNVKLDQTTMPSFLYGLSTFCDEIEPCRATMAEGIWKNCDHETAERLSVTSRPRTFYNFKAPLLRYVQTMTLSSHHRCTCAPSAPLIHRLLSNLKLLRVVRSVCGCPNSCAINALCDSASCPFLNCFADKYVFRNNDGDCGAAAASRMDRQGFLYGVEGRENRTTVVLPRTLGLLHTHGSADIAFRSALDRATTLKIVFADWEGCRNRPNAMTVTLKDARVLLATIADLLRSAPRCHEIVICGLEKLELAAMRGGEASEIDADDLRSLKDQIEDHIRKAVWVQPVLPDSMVHAHDPHTGDIIFSFGSVPHHGGGNAAQPATQGASDDDALPGADVLDPSTLFSSDVDAAEDLDDDGDSEDSGVSVESEGLSDAGSEYESASEGSDDGEEETETENEDDEDGDDEEEGSSDGGHTGEVEDEEDGEMEAASQEFLAALTSGWNFFAMPPPHAGGPSTPGSAPGGHGNTMGSTTTAHNNPISAAASSSASPAAPGTSTANANANSIPSPSTGGAGDAGNTGGGAQVPNGGPAHGPGVNGQSLLAAFQEFVASLTRTEPMDGKVVFRTFDEYLADDDSRGELSL